MYLIESIINLTKHVNICKILITLPSCLLSKLIIILKYNTSNLLDLPSNNGERNIGPGIYNNDNKRIRLKLANITNNNNRDIDQQRQTISD